MNRTARFILIAIFLGASLVASGAASRTGVIDTVDVEKYLNIVADAYMASMQAERIVVGRVAPVSEVVPVRSAAVPYFPSQYVIDAPAGSSEPISTF